MGGESNPDQLMTGERLDSLERWRDDVEQRFAEAFPGGDHMGHCRYHTLMIERTEEIRRLRNAVIEKTIAGLVWAGVLALGLAIWQWVRTNLR